MNYEITKIGYALQGAFVRRFYGKTARVGGFYGLMMACLFHIFHNIAHFDVDLFFGDQEVTGGE